MEEIEQASDPAKGKLVGRLPSAAVMAIPATLGLVEDKISGQRCLLDSGNVGEISSKMVRI